MWPAGYSSGGRIRGRAGHRIIIALQYTCRCHWRIGLAPRFFDLGRGELVFFRRFPFFFEQNPTLNRKKSFRCAKGRAFSFFSGRKKFFLSPKRASPTSSPYSPEVRCHTPRFFELRGPSSGCSFVRFALRTKDRSHRDVLILKHFEYRRTLGYVGLVFVVRTRSTNLDVHNGPA